MALKGTDAPGATPLEMEDIEQLIPDHIQTRPELDEWEAQNIIRAMTTLRRPRELLTDHFLRQLHLRMFGNTWHWAGKYRQRETNIGITPRQIPMAVRNLCEDVRYWRDQAVFPPDELAVRFHHLLVSIHPFTNGNGRHSRLAADLLIVSLGKEAFSWGRTGLVKPGQTRDQYLQSLRLADRGDIKELLAFSRS
ncbi:MAG: mobile mystery protein B [Oleiphilaceae bacterium]|nr:mobile mystery protein B [Oleiphilaceae bacterium]